MKIFNTGNPLGSTAVKDLYDNAQNFDLFSLSPNDYEPDRLNVNRLTLEGIRNQANTALVNTGFEEIGDYANGPLTITRRNQVFTYNGQFYAASAALQLPYTTVNNWATDSPKFVNRGDFVLRQDLAASSGAARIGALSRSGQPSTVAAELQNLNTEISNSGRISLTSLGAKGDGKRVYFNLSVNSGSQAFQIDGAAFTQADVGKIFSLVYSLGTFRSKIQSVQSANQLTTVDAIPVSVSGKNALLTYGSDDTSAIQAAATAYQSQNVEFWMANRTFVVTSTLNVGSGFKLAGVGCEPYVAVDNFPQMGGGAWLHLAHNDKGFSIMPTATGFGSGVRFQKFGTYRDQPLRGVGWTPVPMDYDFYQENVDVHLEQMVMLNPYRGYKITNAGTGRLTINGLQFQPLFMGIDLDFSTDLCRLTQIHDWPYWDAGPIMADWVCKHKTSLRTARADNTFITDYFSIYARDGWLIDGPSYGIQVGTMDMDGNQYGIRATANAVGADVRIANLITQCEPTYAMPGSSIMTEAGSNCGITISNHFSGLAGNATVRQLPNAGSRITIGHHESRNWNYDNKNYACFETANGCTLDVTKYRLVKGVHGDLENVFDGTQLVTAPLQRGRIDTSTDSTGSFVITHGAGAIPKYVDIQGLQGAGLIFTTDPSTWSKTGIVVRAWASSSATASNVTVAVKWEVSL